MRIPRLLANPPLTEGAEICLPEAAARHARSVLRLRPGADVVVFDGCGVAHEARLVRATRDGTWICVGERLDTSVEPPLEVSLALGVSRGERMDLAVQKAVELGVAGIQPLITERSVVRLDADRAARRVAHWQGVTVGACEQCGRNVVPTVATVSRLEDWLAGLRGDALRFVLDPGASSGLIGVPEQEASRVVLLIGPEGGLSNAERDRARQHGFTGIRLGPRVLRTETAVIAAITAVMVLWGDLGR